MSTYTDTTVRVSLATPDDIRELSQKTLHLWVGVTSPLWAPFWAAASFGVGMWALGQGAAKTLGGTLYDKDVPLALKWPGFEAVPKSAELLAHVAETQTELVRDVVDSTVETAGTTQAVGVEATEGFANTAVSAAPVAKVWEKAEAVVEDAADAAVETVEGMTEASKTTAETTGVVASKATARSAQSAKRAAAATLDLLGQQPVPARESKPLIDPVTEKPVIPAIAEATAEPKLSMPKPAPRRPRKG